MYATTLKALKLVILTSIAGIALVAGVLFSSGAYEALTEPQEIYWDYDAGKLVCPVYAATARSAAQQRDDGISIHVVYAYIVENQPKEDMLWSVPLVRDAYSRKELSVHELGLKAVESCNIINGE